MPVLIKLIIDSMRCISAERQTEDMIGLKTSAADKTAAIKRVRSATWVLGNLVRGKPQPKLDLVAPALSTLAKVRTNDVSQELVL